MLLTLSRWCHDSPLGAAVRDSAWLFPAIEGVHLLALALLGGSVLLVDLRLLGLGLSGQPALELRKTTRVWMLGGLVAMLISGVLLWASQALGYYENVPFRVKMLALAVAIVFSLGIEPLLIARAANVRMQRAVATVSLTLWTVVGVAGRGIGFW